MMVLLSSATPRSWHRSFQDWSRWAAFGDQDPRTWGFAMYRASHDDYEPSILPSGHPGGSPQEALDYACGLYLADPPPGSASHPRRINGRDH